MRSGFVQFHDSLEGLMDDIDNVQPHPYNPRNGDVEAIVESISVNGFIAPIVAQRSTGYIIAGNHRYFALKEMGSEQIPVIWVDVDDIAAKRYLLADNRTSDLGQYDNGVLAQILQELNEDDSLLGTGYKEWDLEVLQHLNEINQDESLDFAQWPTLTFQVPPTTKTAFLQLTNGAGDDRERFELLLRLAGWGGDRS